MSGRDEVELALSEAANLPAQQQIPVLERVEPLAEELAATDLLVELKLRLTEAYAFGGRPAAMYAPFSWVIERYDAGEPEVLQEQSWILQYDRMMVTGLCDFPEVPLQQVHSALSQLEERFRRSGQGLSPVLGAQWRVLYETAGAPAAAEVFDRWRHSDQTLSDECQLCDASDRAVHLTWFGRDEEASALLLPLLNQRSCPVQPMLGRSVALEPLLSVGYTHEAAAMHCAGWRSVRREPGQLGVVARHLRALTRAGHLARALRLFTTVSPQFSNARQDLEFAAAGTLLMRRLVENGSGAVELVDGTVEQAASRLAMQASELARRFDLRNGNTSMSEKVERWLGSPVLPAMPLAEAPPSIEDPKSYRERIEAITTRLDGQGRAGEAAELAEEALGVLTSVTPTGLTLSRVDVTETTRHIALLQAHTAGLAEKLGEPDVAVQLCRAALPGLQLAGETSAFVDTAHALARLLMWDEPAEAVALQDQLLATFGHEDGLDASSRLVILLERVWPVNETQGLPAALLALNEAVAANESLGPPTRSRRDVDFEVTLLESMRAQLFEEAGRYREASDILQDLPARLMEAGHALTMVGRSRLRLCRVSLQLGVAPQAILVEATEVAWQALAELDLDLLSQAGTLACALLADDGREAEADQLWDELTGGLQGR